MPQSNDRVGEYILDQKIGGGTFGEVWRARHHVWSDQLVAVKIPTDPQYIRTLQREGSAIHGLVHPNIVRAIGFDPYAAVPYLTMEYIPGTSLRPLVQGRRLSIPDAVSILRQVLAGLSYAHTQGIIHRDIKPENILVHESAATVGYQTPGLIKVTDFGLGKAATTSAVGSIAFSASLNSDAGRELAGTLDYMAPEARSGAEVDARADLYACGVILYELLTGERPAGTDVPSDLNRNVPKSLDDAFRRSYSRLEKRFMSAEEFSRAIAIVPPPLPGANNQRFQAVPRPAVLEAQQKPATGCPRCHRPVDGTDQFCMHCGVQMVTTVRRCKKCGAYPDASDKFCMFCGDGLISELTTA